MLILEVKREEYGQKARKHGKQPPGVFCVQTQNKENFFSLWALATPAGAPIFLLPGVAGSHLITPAPPPPFFFLLRPTRGHKLDLRCALTWANRARAPLRSKVRLTFAQRANISRNYSTPPLTALPPSAERRSYLSKKKDGACRVFDTRY